MAEIRKFIFAIILFLFLFLIIAEASGGIPSSLPFQSYVDCETDKDCPKSVNICYAIRCIDKKCDTVQIYPISYSRKYK
ncbi:unnamed protein product [Trifolium pratense]|uniref:Uncharacterized protein n=1 Tax=Trifolium pratense TaxID=57577 RepID=A0ACB0JV09_TRIPR|nr:unnamed protein product [Trifolium pratense]